MILWYVDRFGLPGSYHRIWVSALLRADLTPKEFLTIDLHRAMQRQLLTKLGSRKAPAWIPTESDNIITKMNQHLQTHKPRAVVLAAPESLAYLGLAPEHATLHNLRGSVYWKHGIPFIVTLPISAWNTLVSQKDIGAANYGFDSQESFTAARSQDGEVSEETTSGGSGLETTGSRAVPGSSRRITDSGSAGAGAAATGINVESRGEPGPRHSEGERANLRDVGIPIAQSRDSHVGSPGDGVLSVRASEDRARGTQAGQDLSRPSDPAQGNGTDASGGGDADSSSSRSNGSGSHSASTSNLFVAFGNPLDLRSRTCLARDGGSSVLGGPDSDESMPADSGFARRDPNGDGPGTLEGVEYRSDRRYDDSGESDLSGDRNDEGSTDTDDVRIDSESDGEDEESSEVSAGLDDDEEVDRFFYEPVLSPVGRYVITADLMKLRRVLRDGKLSSGPAEPLILKW